MKKWKNIALISASALLTIGLAACGSDSDSSSSNSSSSTNSASSSSQVAKSSSTDVSKETFKIGQPVTYKNVTLKVNSIRYSQGDDVETPDNGKQYAIVNVTLTNNSDKSLDYNQDDFAFDYNGDSKDPDCVSLDGVNEMDTGSLDKGSSITKDLVGQVPLQMEAGKLQLTYQPDILNDNLKLHIDLN